MQTNTPIAPAPQTWLGGFVSGAVRLLRGVAAELAETADDLTSPWRRQASSSSPAALTEASALSRRIADEQFMAMMRDIPANLVSSMAGILLFVLGLWETAHHGYLLAWAAWASASIIWGIVDQAMFKRSPPVGEALETWKLELRRGLVLLGAMWGSVMFVPMAPDIRPYIAFGILLVLAGTARLFVTYRPGIALVAAPCTLLTSLSLILNEGGSHGVATGLGFAVFAGLMVRLARSHNDSVTQTMLVAEERKALLEELGRQRREAEHASMAKTFFLASVSHDLRQPMHSIALLVAASRRHGAADAETVEQIGAAVQSMEDLLGALLEVSKLDAGAVPLQIAVFRAGDVLERVRLQFGAQAQAKGLALEIDALTDEVRSDFFQLERIVSNLVANAIRYTPAGRVRMRCRRRGETLWVQVWDSGIGIAPEHRHKIFEDFFQVSRTARSGRQGLGLGLSIVQRASHRLGHPLRVRSRPGRGSVFEIGLPVASASADAPHAAQLAPLLDGKLVLLIDDDPLVLKSMAKLLTAFNCQVLSAGSLDDALAVVEETLRLPDLIVSDYRLGNGRTGLDAIRQVRALAQEDIPALLVTAEPDAIQDPTAIPVLTKPLQPDALATALQRLAFLSDSR